ncbi:DUF4241 domain-containing protein [Ruminococcus albus]|uniref:DUF4241 domain-containing protein n=1 Tax=Ruminococcus albus TaxID=1264 RepID=UPI001D13C943|nr:DUF4241 domain-containing protein [Ruminococcus albus]MCC3352086.1 DUF4241 domain-containing protein [Ruminococcus albus 8]
MNAEFMTKIILQKNARIKNGTNPHFEQRGAAPLDDKAFISSSGYGDGSYECFVARNPEGKIVAIKILFISFEEMRRKNNEKI